MAKWLMVHGCPVAPDLWHGHPEGLQSVAVIIAGVQGLERSSDSILEGERDCKEADLFCHRATQELG